MKYKAQPTECLQTLSHEKQIRKQRNKNELMFNRVFPMLKNVSKQCHCETKVGLHIVKSHTVSLITDGRGVSDADEGAHAGNVVDKAGALVVIALTLFIDCLRQMNSSTNVTVN